MPIAPDLFNGIFHFQYQWARDKVNWRRYEYDLEFGLFVFGVLNDNEFIDVISNPSFEIFILWSNHVGSCIC